MDIKSRWQEVDRVTTNYPVPCLARSDRRQHWSSGAVAAVPISRPRLLGRLLGSRFPRHTDGLAALAAALDRLPGALGGGQGGGGTGGGGGLDMGQSSSQHQAELPNATKRWRHKSL